MADVVRFRGPTRLDVPVADVLEQALVAGMTEVVVIGFDAEGEDYFASSKADGAPVLWHLVRAQHRLMQIVDEMINGE